MHTDNIVLAAGGGANVDLHDKWNGLLGILNQSLGQGTMTAAGWIGVILVVGGFIGWAWSKRKGASDHNKITWTIVVGAILVAPQALYVILMIIDGIANTAIKIFGGGS